VSKKPKRTAEVIKLDILRRFGAKRTAEELAALKPKKATKPKPAPSAEPFVQLPYERFMQAYGKLTAAGLYVAIELERLYFKSGGGDRPKLNPVTLPNKALRNVGMHRSTKAKGLRQLEEAGLVHFTKFGQGAFEVTLTWHPVL
jgi:hypothetical protein